ncbi:hypothetical protein IKW75_00335 [Candidatus Saccharibacteria bacterium]|nr:hypothetical protein [Candidatus Saccharibacteria bacterium]
MAFARKQKTSPEDKRHYLEMIQNIISRLSHEAQTNRGWYIATTTALCTGIVLNGSHGLYRIILAESAMFFLLELSYLTNERRYRKLYENTSVQPYDKIDFSMKVERHFWSDYIGAAFRPINLIYAVMIIYSALKTLMIF